MSENVTKSLRYDFSESELHELSIELANNTKKLRSTNEQKKEMNRKFNDLIKQVKTTCDELSVQVSDGYEYRDISCQVEYHKPSQGQMTVTRTDTGEVFTEQMTEDDWNLFNQV